MRRAIDPATESIGINGREVYSVGQVAAGDDDARDRDRYSRRLADGRPEGHGNEKRQPSAHGIDPSLTRRLDKVPSDSRSVGRAALS